MRFLPILLPAALLLSACGPDSQTTRVKGELKGIDQAVIMVYADDTLNNDPGTADSIKVNRGSFTYERHLEGPQLLTLVYPNSSTTTLVAEPGKTIRLKGDANRLKEIEVSGTPDNELLTAFRLRSLRTAPANVPMEAASFIRSNARTLAAIALFRQHFDAVKERKQQPALGLLDALQKAQPDNVLLRNIAQRLRPQLLTSPGAKLPNFQAKTIKGEALNAQQLKGKTSLIVFYSSWDGEYYTLRNELRKLRKAYGGKLNVLLVCLDPERKAVEKRAQEDSLKQVIHLPEGLASPLVRQLGLRYVPGCLVVDAQGIVVARDLPREEWTETLKSWVR